MKLTIAFVALAMIVSLAANADYMESGGELLRILKSDDASEVSLARGYVAAVQDVYNGTNGLCVPPHVALSHSASATQKWLEDHPERLHERTTSLVFLALREAFPCAEEKK